jgi:hypothetical protein
MHNEPPIFPKWTALGRGSGYVTKLFGVKRFDAMRCDAMRCGAVRCGAVPGAMDGICRMKNKQTKCKDPPFG